MLTFSQFLQYVTGSAPIAVAVILTLCVIFVNGWTDAPNAVATCVMTRCMRPRAAILMAAVCNFAGVFVMSAISPKVAMTIRNMVDFGSDSAAASRALCAALFSIVVWAVLAWAFGIPTSESHALIAGLSGAAMALTGARAIVWQEWVKVLYGLLLSVLAGAALGYTVCRTVLYLCRSRSKRATAPFFTGAQIFGAAAAAFMHGAQDGQKFMGVLLLAVFLSSSTDVAAAELPVWLMLLCSAVMGLGTSLGGKKIIKSVGRDMVRLEKYQGFAADTASAGCLLLATLLGLPVSTTHVKTSAILGVGAVRGRTAVNFGTVGRMALTWILTFPGCGVIGFFSAKLFGAFL